MNESWTAEGAAILERAYEYHGGLERWRRLRRVSMTATRLWGFLPWLKGYGVTFRLPERGDVFPHECRTVFHGYPEGGQRGVFERGAVRIEATATGAVLIESADHRRTFRGLSKNRRWSPLDALYFFGYALWHYHSLPFTLGDARLLRIRRARISGEPLRGLTVLLPEDVPTHSRKQTFYFDGSGCLRRHDYVGEIIGFWARGAHFWNAYQFVEGIPLAAERNVRPCMFGRTFPMTALGATFTDIAIDLAAPGYGQR